MTGPIYPLNANPVLRIPLFYIQKALAFHIPLVATALTHAQNRTQINGVVNLGKDLRKAKGPTPPSFALFYAAPFLTQNILAPSSHPAVLSLEPELDFKTMLYHVRKCRSLHLLDFLSSLLGVSPLP